MGPIHRIASGILIVGVIVGMMPAGEPPRQPWSELASYPGQGLSPLYDPAREECRRILLHGRQWEVLPRPVSSVRIGSDGTPCFGMHNGDTYYHGLYGNPAAIRWAAEHKGEGCFRLSVNSTILANQGDDLCLVVDGDRRTLQVFSGGVWSSYQTLEPGDLGRIRRPCTLARHSRGGWWIASGAGLYHLADGHWERAQIPDWPGGAAQGVVADKTGRAVAWSEKKINDQGTVAFWDQERWSSVQIPRNGPWHEAALRPDGSVLLAGPKQIAIVSPPATIVNEPAADCDPEAAGHLRLGHLPLPGGGWAEVLDSVAISISGGALFAARRLPEGDTGLVRLAPDGPAEWLSFDVAGGIQLSPWGDGGFLICAPGRGIYGLEQDAGEPGLLADADEFLPDDQLLACDREGHVYLKRSPAIVVFSPQAESGEAVEAEPIAEFPMPRVRRGVQAGWPAAVDSLGRCWYVQADGAVMSFAVGEGTPLLVDDRLSGTGSLWPGREGAMLILFADGRAALARPERRLEFAESLVELTSRCLSIMLATAPLASQDVRRGVDRPSRRHRLASPWIAGESGLWISDGRAIWRFNRPSDGVEDAGTVSFERVCDGNFLFLGPLRSKELLLVPREDDQAGRLTSWLSIQDIDADVSPTPVASPPSESAGGLLSNPASVSGPWLLDSEGWLWIEESFDRVYRVDSTSGWRIMRDFGEPELEHPQGCAWAYHSARVFPGYEIAGPDIRRSCRPTYVEHLTPLAVLERGVVCLTPDGLALLAVDLSQPEADSVVDRIRVRWRVRPAIYLGHSESGVYFVSGEHGQSRVVAVEMPKRWRAKP